MRRAHCREVAWSVLDISALCLSNSSLSHRFPQEDRSASELSSEFHSTAFVAIVYTTHDPIHVVGSEARSPKYARQQRAAVRCPLSKTWLLQPIHHSPLGPLAAVAKIIQLVSHAQREHAQAERTSTYSSTPWILSVTTRSNPKLIPRPSNTYILLCQCSHPGGPSSAPSSWAHDCGLNLCWWCAGGHGFCRLPRCSPIITNDGWKSVDCARSEYLTTHAAGRRDCKYQFWIICV